ncbi:MAG TPA: P-II family nitrogen regulator [Nitrososphaeraceae archaeon]|jgi:nitrogen regulatory protein P-II 1
MAQLKKLEIIIPHRWLSEIDEVLKGMQIGGMSAVQIEGRGKVKPLPVAVERGTRTATPEFIPRTKVEVIVKDDMVEEITQKILDRFGGDPNLGGKIFISDVVGAIDFVTKEKDEQAI